MHETVVGQVKAADVVVTRRGARLLTVFVGDDSGTVVAKWFHQPYLKQRFPPGRRVVLSGKVTSNLEMVNPDYEECPESSQDSLDRIVPIYPRVEGLYQRWLRGFMRALVTKWAPAVPDVLPEGIRRRHALLRLPEALQAVHFPKQMEDVEAGRRRLAFDDLLLLSLGVARMRRSAAAEVASMMTGTPDLEAAVRARLGFTLTPAQERVLGEIRADMARPRPMRRLLQGDVGSGKTAVALLAMAHAVGNGFQGAIMAPTEILAEQHYLKARAGLEPVGIEVGFLTGGVSVRQREGVRQAVATGQMHVVIGTHALLQEAVVFRRLGFVVVDEQHRFGVKQRRELSAKGAHPHTLVMTATPIPRTLALALYGDLNISIIDEMPPGRQPVRTELVSEEMRRKAYGYVLAEIQRGGAAYVICPLVEGSDEAQLKAATTLSAELRLGMLRDCRVGCLHGRMRPEEKRRVMDAFRQGDIQVLVATTVVEVGMDVPRATVVVVEHADRLGLTQLHQIRGRVGRAGPPGTCLLIHGRHLTEVAQARLTTLSGCADGFQVAERDLELRGPGELFGTRQAGLPDLKVAQLLRDVRLLELAQREAFALVDEDPDLSAHAALRQAVADRWEGALDLATVG
jgi:ATP-dependent DNA helicase RecG